MTSSPGPSGPRKRPDSPGPIRCRPEAYRLFSNNLPRLDSLAGLTRCAVALALHEMPQFDPRESERQLDRLAHEVRRRLRSGDINAVLAHAHQVLFDEEGFAGNEHDYYHPHNSYLPAVLDTRHGLPITLTLIYKAVLERLGLRVCGINAPGHFMAGVDMQSEQDPTAFMIIDPFHRGRALSLEEAFDLIRELTGLAAAADHLIPPATHRLWLGRMITNLVGAFDRQDRPADVQAMLELQQLLEAHTDSTTSSPGSDPQARYDVDPDNSE